MAAADPTAPTLAQSPSPQSQAAREAVQAALDILGRASSDWRNNGSYEAGSLHWPVAVTHARRLLKAALLALHVEEPRRVVTETAATDAWATWEAHRSRANEL